MKKYTAEEIEKFLVAIDGHLAKPVMIIIIGGTAAALAYKVTTTTQDIDTWNSTKDLQAAYKKAKEETGLDIPLGQASVSDAPYDFEDRLEDYKPALFKNLKVKIPEVVDLILMKILRGYEHDLEAIEEMVENKNVTVNVLAERYAIELKAAIGEKRKLDLNFLVMIERCFGKEISTEIAKEIGFQ